MLAAPSDSIQARTSSKGSNSLPPSIQLPENACLDYLFAASAERQAELVVGRFKELIAEQSVGAEALAGDNMHVSG
jgi:hypothetical protein